MEFDFSSIEAYFDFDREEPNYTQVCENEMLVIFLFHLLHLISKFYSMEKEGFVEVEAYWLTKLSEDMDTICKIFLSNEDLQDLAKMKR